MAWWNRLFKKKEPIQQEEDWEQLVYTRNGVNFDEEDQRKRYIVNCLEQISEASKEIDLLTGEYTLVTSYLTDTDEIEALPAEQREEVNRVAGKLAGLAATGAVRSLEVAVLDKITGEALPELPGGAQLRAFTHEPGTVVAQQKARKAEEQLARGQAALPASWLEDVLTTTV